MAENPLLAHHYAVVADAKQNLGIVPENLRGGLARYLDLGIEPGRFLCSVLENDLAGATLRCSDELVEVCLMSLASFLWNYAPSESHGSKEKRLAWQAKVSAMHARPSEPPPALENGEAALG
jgi:hypothetical protein